MTDKELSLKDISSKELIHETIKDIDYQDTLDTTDAIYVSEKMNSFLDSIVIDDSTISEFTATFHRHDGKDFPSENYIIEKYGVYPDASDPHLRRYTILIPNH